MQVYCENCKKHRGNTFPKKLILISKNKIKGKSKWVIYLTEKTFINETEGKYDIESELEIYLQFFTDWFYKRSMKTYCLKCRKNTENLDSKTFKTKNNRLIMLSKCSDCGIKKIKIRKRTRS